MKLIYMKRPKLRLFTPADLNQILEIEEDSFGSEAFSEETFLRLFQRFPDLFFVAEMDDKIVGYMITCKLSHKGHVASIAVASTFRHKGVGSVLANFTFEKLKASGAKYVELEVRVTNREALDFWKHLGFSPFGISRRFYENGEDALRMKKELVERTDS